MKALLLLFIAVFSSQLSIAQTETELVTKTLNDYLEGTANGEPEKIKRAFHEDLNLYSIDSDTLKFVSGSTYIGYFKPGQKRDRLGEIISIEITNDAAIAKIEINMPSKKRLYTDYLLLLKIEGDWKIIHKSYTFENY